MKKLVLAIVATMLLAGCSSMIMQGYVGKDISEPIMDYGYPANAIDLPNGNRAFQWHITTSHYTPTTVTSTGNTDGTASLHGNMLSYNAYNTQTSIVNQGGLSINECMYTLIAKKNREIESWTIVDYRKPTFRCE
jgi:hypothetical protein